MIPDLATIVAAYVVFRAVEAMMVKRDLAAGIAVTLFAVATIAVTVFMWFDIAARGAKGLPALP